MSCYNTSAYVRDHLNNMKFVRLEKDWWEVTLGEVVFYIDGDAFMLMDGYRNPDPDYDYFPLAKRKKSKKKESTND